VTHFLDTLPVNSLPAIRAGAAGLRSDSYYVEAPVHRLVRKAGIKPATISWSQPICDPHSRSSSVRRAARYGRPSGRVGPGRRTEQLGEQRPEHGARLGDGPDNPLALIVPIGVRIGQQPDAHAARVAPRPDHDDAGLRRLHAVIVSGERVTPHQSSIGSGTSPAAGGYGPVRTMPPRRSRS
jgi:hypothetical protein